MSLKHRFADLPISAKMLALNLLIGAAFLLIGSIVFFAFMTVQNIASEITSQGTRKLVANAQITRELSKMYSDINLVEHTFYGRNDHLIAESRRITTTAENLFKNTSDPGLKESLRDLRHHLDLFFNQCTVVNSALQAQESIDFKTQEGLSRLEDMISALLLQYTLDGEDTSFVEQLLTLVVGYRESTRQIGKMLVEQKFNYYAMPLGDEKSESILKLIDDLSLRLQTISASVPEIAVHGKYIGENVQRYREVIIDIYGAIDELNSCKTSLAGVLAQSIVEMERFEEYAIQSTQRLNSDIKKTVSLAGLAVLLLSVIVVVVLFIATAYLIRSSIKLPMKALLSGLDSFKHNNLEFQIDLGRKDEWDDLEKGLNKMASEIFRTYKALRDSEEKFRQLAELLPQPVFEVSVEGLITYSNKSGCKVFGHCLEDFEQGVKFVELFIRSERKRLARGFAEILRGGHVGSHDFTGLAKSGKELPTLVYLSAIVQNGKKLGVRGIVVDISERVGMERALKENELFLNSVIENIPNMIFVKDADELRFVSLNHAGEELLGYSRESLVGKSDFDFFPEKEAQFFTGKDREVLRNKKLVDIAEESIQTRINGRRYLHTKKIPILDANGIPKFLLGISEDITERKQVEEELRQYSDTQDVLLREVNHRVKNNLTAIISMLHHEQSRTAQATPADKSIQLQDIISRIEGLLTVHALLSSRQWQPLTLSILCDEVVRKTTRSAPTSNPANLVVAPSDLLVDSDQAHHLALILNELATNSMKHGITSVNAEIHVQITINKQEDNIVLFYLDNGPGYCEEILSGALSKDNIGFYLIRGIVKKSLRGKLELINDNGAGAIITFPAATCNSK